MSKMLLKKLIEQTIAGDKDGAKTSFHQYLTKKMGSLVAEGAGASTVQSNAETESDAIDRESANNED